MTLRFVKPHGALYNQAQRDEAIARGVVAAVGRLGLPVLGQPGSVLERLADEAGVRFVAEGFPDRRYGPDGRLVAAEPARRRPARPGRGRGAGRPVRRPKGSTTLCIHGDDPRAVANAESVRAVLARHEIAPRFWG